MGGVGVRRVGPGGGLRVPVVGGRVVAVGSGGCEPGEICVVLEGVVDDR